MIARYLWLSVLVAAACKPGGPAVGRTGGQTGDSSPTARPPDRPPASGPTVVILGTSLTAGYGLPDPGTQSYPALLQQKLDSAGRRFQVVNAGLSGESSAGALSRIDFLLSRDTVAVLIVETGANDGLRGQDPDSVRARIQAIFDRARQHDPSPRLIVVGMEALPNLGQDYVRRFHAIYPEVARANGAALVPFLLAGVAGVDSLNQDDGIHPTAVGHRRLAENVWPVLEQVTRTPWRR